MVVASLVRVLELGSSPLSCSSILSRVCGVCIGSFLILPLGSDSPASVLLGQLPSFSIPAATSCSPRLDPHFPLAVSSSPSQSLAAVDPCSDLAPSSLDLQLLIAQTQTPPLLPFSAPASFQLAFFQPTQVSLPAILVLPLPAPLSSNLAPVASSLIALVFPNCSPPSIGAPA